MPITEQLTRALDGRYAIERLVGEGGMASVYLARDVRHDRQVALKVLKPDLGAILGAERFLAEIQVTARLQHPNLLPLFDSGEAGGLLFYVMPFVQGETLRTRLEREKQLPVAEAVRLVSAVAAALEHAHRQGIIHRDLKPENILLQDGQPLVADFGIALAVSKAGGHRMTQTGLSLGTPQYMSPEQATGDRVIDARSDVYALGAIAYEMLTGEPPHTGSTSQAIIARLMTEKPRSIRTTRPTVPASVEAAVERALEKLPADRWSTAKELGDALQAASTGSGGRPEVPGSKEGAAPSSRAARRLAAAGAAGVLVGATAIGALALARARAPAPAVAFEVTPPRGVKIINPIGRPLDISPDGKTIAFLGADSSAPGGRIYVRRLDSLAAEPLAGTEGANSPSFGPDGENLIFALPNAVLNRTSVSAKRPSIVMPLRDFAGYGWGAGRFAAVAMGTSGDSLLLRDPVGTEQRVIPMHVSDSSGGTSVPSPVGDGGIIVVRVHSPGYPLGLVDANRRTLTTVDAELGGTMDGVVGFIEGVLVVGLDEGRIVGLPVDLGTRRATGRAVPLLDGVSTKLLGGVNARLAANGTLVYMIGGSGARIVLSRGDSVVNVSVEGAVLFTDLAWSPDGGRLAFTSWRNGSQLSQELWVLDARSGAKRRLVDGVAFAPAWSPDGRLLAFERDGDQSGVFVVPLDGSRPATRAGGPAYRQPAFMPDGRSLVVRKDSVAAPGRLVRVALDGSPREEVLVSERYWVGEPAVSPDGKWLAFTSKETGTSRVYVTPMRPGGGRVPVWSESASQPRWSPDGRRLYLKAADEHLVVVNLDFAAGGVNIGRVAPALPVADVRNAAVHPDGRRFAAMRNGTEEELRIVVHTNWWQSVRDRMRAAR